MSRAFSEEWAAQVEDRLSKGFTEEDKADKLPDYWRWIAGAASSFTGVLGLGVRTDPHSDLHDAEFIAVEISAGVVTSVRVSTYEEIGKSDYLLMGTYESWRRYLAGYDPGKAIMYRLFRLEHGNMLGFFNRAYYWIELIALLQSIPAKVTEPSKVAA